MTLEKVAGHRCYEGVQQRFRHHSDSLNCDMHFSLYLPPLRSARPVPLLYWLSGLTCTDENFVSKAGAQRYAAAHGIALLAPDTSPRGAEVPDDPDGSWDFGLGAGFYVNATQPPWDTHYRMYDYVVEELPALVRKHFAADFAVDADNAAISGHSMGGHGALSIALRNPQRYRSVSAFAPIVAPGAVPWGRKALGNYLGDDPARWAEHDSCALIRQGAQQLPLLVDQGEDDEFLAEQLQTHLLASACEQANYPATIRYQPGYDHSYFFIASFIGSHIEFHARALGVGGSK